MNRFARITIPTAIALLVAALAATPAAAEYGLQEVDATFTQADGSPALQAGSHPYAVTTSALLNYKTGPSGFELDGELKDLIVEAIPGFTGNTTAMPRCTTIDFITPGSHNSSCPTETAVGVSASRVGELDSWGQAPVFNLEPPPGIPVRLGFVVLNTPVVIDIGISRQHPYNVRAILHNTSQLLTVFGGVVQLWGDPTDPRHDALRGGCGETQISGVEDFEFVPSSGTCPVQAAEKPFLTLPRSCTGPARTSWESDSWQNPGKWVRGSFLTHDDAVPPNPTGFVACDRLGFAPAVESSLTTESAETGTGLDFNVDFNDEGLVSPDGLAQSEAKKVVVTLPEGVTVNPSIGEGLGVCTPADIARETLHAKPGEGCPNASKIGTLRLETPLVDESVQGSVYLAEQDDPTTSRPGAENPFDSLIALYLVLRNTNLGVNVKLPVKVEPDRATGQLKATLEDIPQIPFSHFNFHFREGQRAPLVSPPTCGTYATKAKFYPWSDPSNPRTVTSTFKIEKGVGGGPCPSAGIPPFAPHFQAGSTNNNAGSFSPFTMRLTRNDGQQNMTKFSSVLPPGVLGKLAGVARCPDANIAVARAKTGRGELASPSCPVNSQIGRTLAGAGVGGALTYVPGQLYLAGPYKGAPLSVVSITPAVAGPFDAGTVVVRVALTLNPKTVQVEVDGSASDPIPHILKGIVLKVRDLRVYVDRPSFIVNPTNCGESLARATIFGSYLDVFSPVDDVPVARSARYQAANCLNLPFKPKLAIKLKGGVKRGAHPGLRAIVTPPPGQANFSRAAVTLPRSAFLEQAHIRTICTRVQFNAPPGHGAHCPPGARYGYARAWSPLLDAPAQGPVYLRSSENRLPDLVVALKGPASAPVDVELSARIDSVRGGIRSTFTGIPDAPVSRFILDMQGGKKGLIVNSRHLCHKPGRNRARSNLTGQNGARHNTRPRVIAVKCQKRRKAKRARAKRAAGHLSRANAVE